MQNCQIPEFWRPLYVPEFDPPALFMLQPKIQKSSSRLFLGLLKGFQQFGSFRLIFCLQYNFLNVLCLLTYTFLSPVLFDNRGQYHSRGAYWFIEFRLATILSIIIMNKRVKLL